MRAIARYVAEEIASTLPRTEHDAGMFVAGLAYGLVLYLGLMLLVSAATLWAQGRGW